MLLVAAASMMMLVGGAVLKCKFYNQRKLYFAWDWLAVRKGFLLIQENFTLASPPPV